RLQREHSQAVMDGMPRKIDQHIDGVASDQFGSGFVTNAENVVPVVETFLEAQSCLIRIFIVVISVCLEEVWVLMREQLFEEAPHDVPSEITRNIANLQPPFGVAGIEKRRNPGPLARAKKFVVLHML